MDLWDVDIRRFMPFQGNARYLRERTREVVGLLYAMHWPFRQPETARGVRRSVLHDRLAAARRRASAWPPAGSARTGSRTDGVEPRYVYTYGRQNWFPCAAAEHRAVREAVGLFDQSSLAKFLLQGPDAVATLQRLCANDVDVAPGRIVYTQMLNRRGGIECRPDRDARWPTTRTWSSRSPPRRPTTPTGSAAASARRASRSPTSPRRSPCSA